MNPDIQKLQPYPFDRLRGLLAGVQPHPELPFVDLSIGEPKHATPPFICDRLTSTLSGLAVYPPTLGSPKLRETLADWLKRRHQLDALDAATQVLPILGSREALFAFAQTVIDRSKPNAAVLCPNPFYQIYEGAAFLAGARPIFANTTAETGWKIDLDAVPASTWQDVQLIYVCTPGNPSGAIMTLDDWRKLFELADRYDFVIASDECYSEIYLDEDQPPLGGLAAAQQLGRKGYERLVAFGSLSKRSNVPGLRSGYVAGDASILKPFLLYRTYHGSAMSLPVQEASIAAWQDEAHVVENRALYRQKFDAVLPILAQAFAVERPAAGFYVWLPVQGDDASFCRELLQTMHVKTLPGSYLAREADGFNPGKGRLRLALVAPPQDCVIAAQRIVEFAKGWKG